jgi:pimeloyl-ACP methyl ester carboxylesterase
MSFRRIVAIAMIAGVLLYLAVVAALYLMQRRLIYPGWWLGTAEETAGYAGYRNVAITTADGLRGHLLWHPPQPGKPVILFFHGNGDSVRSSMVSVERLVAMGYGAVLPEYRGYAGNAGKPDEQGLYRDARAAVAWMSANHIDPKHVIVIGYSLGTGVATQMAIETPPRALVLIAPYASIVHVTAARFPWLPANWLVTERFDTAARIRRISCPMLLIHGAADRTIPPENSLMLKTIQPHADRIVFPGIGHEVGFAPATQAAIATWLKGRGV